MNVWFTSRPLRDDSAERGWVVLDQPQRADAAETLRLVFDTAAVLGLRLRRAK